MSELIQPTGSELECKVSPFLITLVFGSTDVKIAKFQPDLTFKESWFGYIAEVRKICGSNGSLSVLSGEKLSQLEDEIKSNVSSNSLEGVCLTGAKNPLWISYKGEDYIIFDDPSPDTPVSSDQMTEINQIFETDLTDIEHSSALYKLLQLKFNPEYRMTIFGEDVDFCQMQFGSVNGYVATVISGEKYSYFESDIQGFGVNGCVDDQIQKMLDIILPADKTQYFISRNPENFLVMDDFGAETLITKMLIDQGLIDYQAIFIAWDSVAKIMSVNNPNKGFGKQKNGVFYTTQRNGARTNKDGAEITQMDIHDFYVYIDKLLLSQYPPTDWIYHPDNGGKLYQLIDGFWQQRELDYKVLGQLGSDEIDKLILAISYGVVCGIYEKIDRIFPGQGKKLFNMGGWANAKNKQGKQHGRLMTMRRLADRKDQVNKFKLPSAGIAVGLIYLIQKGYPVDIMNIIGQVEPIGDGYGDDDIYRYWWAGQQKAIANQRTSTGLYLLN